MYLLFLNKKYRGKMKKVTIITPAFQAQNYIQRYLNCVYLFDYKNIELIIINDGSTDKTEEIINANIQKIYANGDKAYSLFKKYYSKDIKIIKLPSTSPANAQYNLEKLCNEWRQIFDGIN